ncbi:acyl-CoA thioester hydrolase [Halobacillus dabanensis]|uniref:Acyl-CoA thioester hydrolase n=1 Tax=Halobacillus dabanensis TaxID=240302 RepID=A0A1I3XMF5_HALDA|nr:thioesterase family protein [Halobacillus dabanensis]SFK20713.1 acyl-CoA thioester hydrolase [Halobacillus dabanensis]
MHEIEVNIRFCETDLLGHVNNNNFFVYMEDARINFFKDLDLVGDDWNFIIASTKCDFIKQVYFNQTLLIRSHVGRIGNSSFHLEQEMFEKDSGELVAKGLSVVVHFDFEHQESSPLSQKMRESLESFQLATK